MKERLYGNEYRYFVIYIDEFNNNIISGNYYNSYLRNEIKFYGLLDLILKIDDLLNEMGNVQQDCIIRNFTKNLNLVNNLENNLKLKNGKIATFSIKIMFRQNASWQGSIT